MPLHSSAARHRRTPRPRWMLVVAVFGMFVSVLVTNGLISSEIGVDATGAGSDGPDSGVPSVISNGGPVIDLTSGRTRSLELPPKTVALTFDDGPDPTWTPRVLDVLRARRARRPSSSSARRSPSTPSWSGDIAPRGPRSGCTRSPTPTWPAVAPRRRRPGARPRPSWPSPVRPGSRATSSGRRTRRSPTRRRRRVRRHAGRRQPRLRHRARRPRQRGLAARRASTRSSRTPRRGAATGASC